MSFWRQLLAALARETPAYRDPDAARLQAQLDDAVSTLQRIAAGGQPTYTEDAASPPYDCQTCYGPVMAAVCLARLGQPVSTPPATDENVTGDTP